MSVSFFGLLVYWVVNSALPHAVIILLTVILVMLIIMIGFSRVYLRVHYASDVLAGFIIGLIWLLITLGVVGNAERDSLAVVCFPVLYLC